MKPLISIYFYRFVSNFDIKDTIVNLKVISCTRILDHIENFEGYESNPYEISTKWLEEHYGEIIIKHNLMDKQTVMSNLLLFFNLFAEQGIQIEWEEINIESISEVQNESINILSQ